MTDGIHVTGASSPIQLGNTTYQMSPMRDIDIVECDEWVRSQYLKTALSGIPKAISNVEYDRLVSIAYDKAASVTFMGGVGAKIIASVDGMAHLMYYSVRQNHPDVSLESLRQLMFSSENIAKARKKIEQLNIPRSNEGSKKGVRRKKKKKR